MTSAAIELIGVRKSYDGGQSYAVNTVDLAVAVGEVVALVGGSGSGKTTTLKMINRLIEPTSGTIRVHGEDVTKSDPVLLRRSIGYAFQSVGLFPHLSVGQNLSFGIPGDIRGKNRKDRIDDALSSAGLAGFADRDPHSLSGGQRARVSLLRTLLSQPKALLLDEPFSSLDEATKDDVRAFTAGQIAACKLPTILVTHDPRDADSLSARTLTLPSNEAPTRLPLPTSAK